MNSMKRCSLSVLCSVFLFLSLFPGKLLSAPLIIDHTDVDRCQDIPQAWIDEVKKMWASLPGESHSSGYRIGCTLLQTADSKFAVSIAESGTPEAATSSHLRFSRATWGDVGAATGWRYGYGEEDWYTSMTD